METGSTAQRVVITGHVLTTDGQTVFGAKVDFWLLLKNATQSGGSLEGSFDLVVAPG
ncbi:MAG: hypothetical protein V1912_00190 [bacterium]